MPEQSFPGPLHRNPMPVAGACSALLGKRGTMSRYNLEPLASRYEVSIGWDPGLGNYFLQVLDHEVDETEQDPMIVWVGADWPVTETDVDRVLDEACKWAIIPNDLRFHLLADRASKGTHASPLFLQWLARNGPPVTEES